MPIVEAGSAGPGWTCTCLAHRRKPTNLVKTLARAAGVRVEDLGIKDDVHWFRAGAGDTMYRVGYSLTESGGWCKHCAACAAVLTSEWLRRSYSEVAEAIGALGALGKEMKKVNRELAKLEKMAKECGGP